MFQGHSSSGDEEPDAPPGALSASGTGHTAIRDRLRSKRLAVTVYREGKAPPSVSDRERKASRKVDHHGRSGIRRLRWRSLCYVFVLGVIFVYALASVMLQSSIASFVFRQRSSRMERLLQELKLGSSLNFVPRRMYGDFYRQSGPHRLRDRATLTRRPPRLALVLGNMKNDAPSLMLYTVITNLQKLSYVFKIYATENGQTRLLWEKIAGQITILSPETYGHVDWLNFEGVIADSLQAKDVVSSLMMEPYYSLPLVWIIQEDTLANRLPVYKDLGWNHLVSHWNDTFRRPDVIVFPDFSLPMLYSVLDTGNFFVVPGSPVDVWAAESYSKTYSRSQLRRESGFGMNDKLVLVAGSSFLYNELSWENAMAMHDIEPLLVKYAGRSNLNGSFKFLLLFGKSGDGHNDALQATATRLGLHHGSLKHYGIDGDVDSLLLMSDIFLYVSSQDEQGFPSLLARAISFGIPVIAPEYPIIKKHVHDKVNGRLFAKHKPEALMEAFSHILASDIKVSAFVHDVGEEKKFRARNLFASECVTGYAMLLENVLIFPSNSLLPSVISELGEITWEWSTFLKETGDFASSDGETSSSRNSSIVYVLEGKTSELITSKNSFRNDTRKKEDDVPSELDWDILREIESSEEVEQLEMEEMDERMEKDFGAWEEIYRNARKAEKLKLVSNERDEGELERTGQRLCIYEIYNGVGDWPLLHHGSLYRGLSMSRRERRLRSDDVDAVSRLPLLNDMYYRDILGDIGGMFSIANMLDNVHKCPWIGFQSSHALARKVSLSTKAGQILEEVTRKETKGDVIYFWVRLGMDDGYKRSNDELKFWSMCDTLNGGNCRAIFEDAFRRMYSIPSNTEALPPMPEDRGHWSTMHSWVMPTSSFLEFVMFSRMFVDSVNELHVNLDCQLGTSMQEKQHCYTRILELLVNIWAYHSGRKMVYINPVTGVLQEQHFVEQRKRYMWPKYFNGRLLKAMDEDLAEAADDNEYPYENWLWPLTGEVYWKGVYDREREERYRAKLDKKRKMKDKLHDRMKYGYQQKTLG